jgi:hypothetical protein
MWKEQPQPAQKSSEIDVDKLLELNKSLERKNRRASNARR